MSSKRLLVICFVLPFLIGGCQTIALSPGFVSNWPTQVDRIWLGEKYWANRLQDWQVKNGRIECVVDRVAPMRTVHLLTARLGQQEGGFDMSVRTGMLATSKGDPAQSATGFLLGVGHGEMDYRSAAIVQWWPGQGAGYFAGITGHGELFIRDNEKGDQATLATGALTQGIPRDVLMKLSAHVDGTDYTLRVEVWDPFKLVRLDSASCTVPSERLVGNVALVSHPGTPQQNEQPAPTNYWFRDWRLSGDKVNYHAEDTCGPILCTQYTLSQGVMKMTAQLMPVGDFESPLLKLQVNRSGIWKTLAEESLIVPGWTATFRVPEWKGDKDVPYRVTWNGHSWGGTVRRDPVDKSTIVVAGFTGNHNNSHSIGGGWGASNPEKNNWIEGMWFPHTEIVEHVSQQQPDVLFFSGDQVYEGKSPTFADTQHIKLDYLYKWYLWCWAYRDLTKDIPAVTMPDDHDVYQGNLWGEGGRKSPGNDHHGGYVHPADFVRMVERTQTSHLPDPYDPTPLEQGITSYYTSMIYGGIGFAVLEDRKFKSGCARPEMPATGTARPDHVNDPDFDVSSLDIPGLKLLGDKQLEFLHAFAQDWSGQEMKIALSQTIFANLATHHGGALSRLRCDLDSNGWPQAGRNRAVDALRRGFMFHLAGDQHLGTLVHHGIAEHGDAMWSMCVPSVANFYPRAWAPRCDMPYENPQPQDYLGEFRDGFGHPVTVYAATNPGPDMGQENKDLHDKMPGYGIVRMNKSARTYTVECWPRFADPNQDKQYEGWPKTIAQMENYGRRAFGYLPTLKVDGAIDPVAQVINESTGEILYTLRIKGTELRAPVFEDGVYTVKLIDPENNNAVDTKGLKPSPVAAPTVN
jgi:alkaline phosphatase D